MKPWIKAGLIGATMTVFLTLISRVLYFFPANGFTTILSQISWIPFLIVYPTTGILGAHWLPTPRTVRQGGITGLLAGVLCGVIDGAVSMFIDVVIPMTGTTERFNQLLQGPNKALAYAVYIGILVCWGLFWFGLSVFLSGAGGAIYAAIKEEPEAVKSSETL